MKTFIALFALVALISATAVDEKAAKAAEKAAFLGKLAAECSQEVGFDIGAASKLLHGDFSDRSEQAKCFMKCFFIKEGFMNEKAETQNEFIVSALLESTKMSREKLAEIINRCSTFKGDDSCANAYELLECFTIDKDVIANAIP